MVSGVTFLYIWGDAMCVSRFVVTSSFGAWSPADRDCPEKRLSIAPGAKDLFTDDAEGVGVFVKFLKGGLWFEAARRDFEGSTRPCCRLSAPRSA